MSMNSNKTGYSNQPLGSNLGMPLFTSCRFILSIAGLESDHDKQNIASFARCSGFSYNAKSLVGRFGGDDFYTGGYRIRLGMEYSKITLSKGVITDDRLFNLATASQHKYTDQSGAASILKDKAIVLTAQTYSYNSQGKRVLNEVNWRFLNVAAIGYELAPFDASRGEILMENFSFFFWGVERESEITEVEDESKK